MKWVNAVVFVVFMIAPIYGQSDLQKLVDTERSFAEFATKNGTKAAFLEYLSEDGVLFLPDKVNGKTYWSENGESTDLLSWAPNYADISANGILGYTTGNWEFRAKRDDAVAGAFGEFVSIWLRHPNGKYKLVADIGISHPKPEKYAADLLISSDMVKDQNEINSSAGDHANGFFTAITEKGIESAYKFYADENIRAFREDKMPLLGKKAVLKFLKGERATYRLPKRSVFFGSADLAYNTNTYSKIVDGKIVEKGNTLQIWKLINGKWQIVLDVFKFVP